MLKETERMEESMLSKHPTMRTSNAMTPTKVYFNQVLAVCAVALGPLAVGIGKGYSSPALASILLASSTDAVSTTNGNESSLFGREFMVMNEDGSSLSRQASTSNNLYSSRSSLPDVTTEVAPLSLSIALLNDSGNASSSPVLLETDHTTPMAFFSSTVPVLNSSDSSASSDLQQLRLSVKHVSWLPASSLLGACLASLPCGLALARLPRRCLMYASSAAMIFAWSMMALTVNTILIYISALISGACAAVISLTADLYVAEVAPNTRRASYLMPLRAAASGGQLLSWILGAWLSWRQLAVVAAAVPTLLLLAVWLLIPESPLFLTSRGRHQSAQRALQRLHNGNKCANQQEEICDIEINSISAKSTPAASSMPGELLHPLVKHPLGVVNQKRRVPLAAIAITCALALVSKCSGAAAFHFYAAPFLLSTTMPVLSAHYVAISTLALQTITAAAFSGRVVDRWGRRPALIVGCITMATGSAVFGCVHFYLNRLSTATSQYSTVPIWCNVLAVAALMLVQLAHALCVSPVVHLLIAELFPMHQRGWSSVPFLISYACSFLSVKSHVSLQQRLGLYGVFWVYSSVSIIGLYFVCLAVPETRGKQLGQALRKCPSPSRV